MTNSILEMRSITKTFPGVKALQNVTLEVERGEIHAICGENGAGKSTLMKVLSGVYPTGTYEGEIVFEGETMHFHNLRDSEAKGIVIIHQELALSPHLSIAENIFLNNEVKGPLGLIDWNKTNQEAQKLLARVGLKDNPTTKIKHIGVGKQQLVEIAKALSKRVKLLILDEPTAALNDEDSDHLLDLIKHLKEQGITSIIISHKLNEIKKVADSVTVIRDGKAIETIDKKDVTEDRIIKDMVGRDLEHRYPEHTPNIGEEVLRVEDWTAHHPQDPTRVMVDNVNISVRAGEIVGIAGLMGAGRTEFAMSLFGRSYGTRISGKVFKDGKEIKTRSVSEAIDNGIAYLTEDRKYYGLNLIEDIKRNISVASLQKVARFGLVNDGKEFQIANGFRKDLNIKAPDVMVSTGKLSGGNQQKVVLSKWINSAPDVLILDEPTRGIDVGAKYEIYTIINRLAAEGKAIIVISSELAGAHRHLRPHLRPVRRPHHRGAPHREGHPRSPHQAHDHGEAALMSNPASTETELTEQVGPPTNRFTLALTHVVSDLGKNGIFIALVAVVLFFTITTNGILLRPQNISNLIVQNGYILVLAIGMVLIIVAGHIDLSVGSVAAFIGAVSGVFAVHWGLPWWLAIILSLAVGALVGAWQGFWVAYVGIPAFIVTLAGMLIFRGLALVVLGNANIGSFPAEYRAIGNGFINFPIETGPASADRSDHPHHRRRRGRRTDRAADPHAPRTPELRAGGGAVRLVRREDGVRRRRRRALRLRAVGLQGHPGHAHRARGAGADLRHPAEPQRDRPPHLRDRRQPPRGGAVGHQDAPGRLLPVRQHGRSRRARRHDLHRPAQPGRPEGR